MVLTTSSSSIQSEVDTPSLQVQILRLNGRFDAYEIPSVMAYFNEKIDAEQIHFVVNLTNVTFIDSAALSTLVQVMKRARQRNGDCKLCTLQQSVRIIFELTRLDKAFQIFDDESVAVQSYALQPVI